MHQISSRGFTLLEVLVAFVIMAGTLAVILQAFSSGNANLSRMDRITQAALLAESRLSELGILYPIESIELTGEEESSDFDWRIVMEPYELVFEEADLEGPLESNLYLVKVVVGWPMGTDKNHFELVSLRKGAAI